MLQIGISFLAILFLLAVLVSAIRTAQTMKAARECLESLCLLGVLSRLEYSYPGGEQTLTFTVDGEMYAVSKSKWRSDSSLPLTCRHQLQALPFWTLVRAGEHLGVDRRVYKFLDEGDGGGDPDSIVDPWILVPANAR